MTKGDPEDLHNLAEDLKGCLHRHPDAIQHNPDIAGDIVRSQDKAEQRYRSLTEKPHIPTPKATGWVE